MNNLTNQVCSQPFSTVDGRENPGPIPGTSVGDLCFSVSFAPKIDDHEVCLAAAALARL